MVAFTAHNAFDDDHIIHRLTTMDIETHEKAFDSYNYTIVELAKVPPRKPRTAVEKWAFLFKYLNRLAKRPAELKDKRFDHLFSSATVSKFTAEEYKEYEKLHNLEFEHNAMAAGFFEEFASEVKELKDKAREEGHEEGRKEGHEEGRDKERRETALAMLADNEPLEKICKFSRLSESEVLELKKELDNSKK